MKHKWIRRIKPHKIKIKKFVSDRFWMPLPPVRFCARCHKHYRKGEVGKECKPVEPKWMRVKKDALAYPGQLMQVIRFTEGGTAVGWIKNKDESGWEMGAQELNVSMLEEL